MMPLSSLPEIEFVSSDKETVLAELINLWSCDTVGKYGYTRIGAVVGATWPEQLLELRRKFPKLFFLVPGYGSQGGGAEDVRGAFDHNGLGALVNNSRGIMCAYQHNGGDYQKAALEETIKMRDALRAVSGL